MIQLQIFKSAADWRNNSLLMGQQSGLLGGLQGFRTLNPALMLCLAHAADERGISLCFMTVKLSW